MNINNPVFVGKHIVMTKLFMDIDSNLRRTVFLSEFLLENVKKKISGPFFTFSPVVFILLVIFYALKDFSIVEDILKVLMLIFYLFIMVLAAFKTTYSKINELDYRQSSIANKIFMSVGGKSHIIEEVTKFDVLKFARFAFSKSKSVEKVDNIYQHDKRKGSRKLKKLHNFHSLEAKKYSDVCVYTEEKFIDLIFKNNVVIEHKDKILLYEARRLKEIVFFLEELSIITRIPQTKLILLFLHKGKEIKYKSVTTTRNRMK